MPFAAFPILVLLTAIQRILELYHSRRNQDMMRERGFHHVEKPLSYAMMVAVHASWLAAMMIEHYVYPHSLGVVVEWVALATFLCGQTLRVWAIRTLGTQWNTQIMAPSDAEYLAIVTSGPYRFVRHPNYLAVIIEFASLPIIGGAVVTAIVWSILNGLILKTRIRSEEEYLRRRPGYSESFDAIPLLLPRLRRKSV